MGVNEYSVIEKTADYKDYIEEIKDIEANGGKIDVVGLEGHFGDYVERSDYMKKIEMHGEKESAVFWLIQVLTKLKLANAGKIFATPGVPIHQGS